MLRLLLLHFENHCSEAMILKWERFCPLSGHLAMSGDMFDSHNWVCVGGFLLASSG